MRYVAIQASNPTTTGDENIMQQLTTTLGLVLLLAAVAVGAKDYRPPDDWNGKKTGKTDGNPIKRSSAYWRLDRIWPDNAMEYDNYVTMIWSGKSWHAAENSHGGQPGATVTDGVIKLGARSQWTGTESQKLPALIFVVPFSGKYTVNAAVTHQRWDGKGVCKLQVLLRRKSKKVELIGEIEFGADGGTEELKEIEMKCRSRDEIVIVPKFTKYHQAGGFSIKDLVISR